MIFAFGMIVGYYSTIIFSVYYDHQITDSSSREPFNRGNRSTTILHLIIVYHAKSVRKFVNLGDLVCLSLKIWVLL